MLCRSLMIVSPLANHHLFVMVTGIGRQLGRVNHLQVPFMEKDGRIVSVIIMTVIKLPRQP